MQLQILTLIAVCAVVFGQEEIISAHKRDPATDGDEIVSPFEHAGKDAEMKMLKRDEDGQKKKRAVASSVDIATVLMNHNKYRALEGAANMNKLVYNDYLARMAEEWALGCNFVHGHPARTDKPWDWIGQNLYAVSVPKMNYTRAVLAWYNEKKDYVFDTATCTPGKICGHYTQVVWHESTSVGCAATICPVLKDTPFTNAGYIVCNYGPGGNYVGEKPFTKGAACSACPAGKTCSNGLCE